MSISKIIVCTHKKDFTLQNEVYMPLHVGKACSKLDLGIQGDDTGENISHKNPNYCELTGLYWAWKNLKNIDYIGLAHYRRYFDFTESVASRVNIYNTTADDIQNKLLKLTHGENLLGNYDIILPRPWYMSNSVKDMYIHSHIIEEYYILVRTILMLYPDYKGSIEKYWCKDNRWICFNMFFTKHDIFDDYCTWLFSILSEVEKRARISDYAFQRRIFGFMSEIMLPLYCFHNKLKIKYMPIAMVGEDKSIPSNRKKYIQDLKSNLLFRLNKPVKGYYDITGKSFDACFQQDNITFDK